MSGPAIRAWALARALAQRFDVTAAVMDPPAEALSGVRLVPFTRRRLLRELMFHDVVMSACLPPYLLPLTKARPTLVVADQYDPVDLEVAMLPSSTGARRAVASQLAVTELQLRYADVLLCANARQRERIGTRLAALGRNAGPTLVELPFGLEDSAPESDAHPLRERFPAIGEGDTVVLWWGIVWRWLDGETAVRAFAELAARRPDIKLVFAPARTLGAATEALNGTERVRVLARALGVLDQTVFFWDDWVPFDRRHEVLADADIGLSLHGKTEEAHLSARVRYLDYLWARLPCVLAEGDETGSHFADAGFATLVAPGDAAGVSEALIRLADDRSALVRAREASVALSHAYRWSTLAQPLIRILERSTPTAERSYPRLAARVGGYYARRAGDKSVVAWERLRPSAQVE